MYKCILCSIDHGYGAWGVSIDSEWGLSPIVVLRVSNLGVKTLIIEMHLLRNDSGLP